MRLRIAVPCDEDFDQMRPTEGGARFCERCEKVVHPIASGDDARRLMRDARRRGEGWACIRVAVTAMTLASCAHETQSLEFAPTVPAPGSQPRVPGICDIDPVACATGKRYQKEMYIAGAVEIPQTGWGALTARAERMLRRAFARR